MREGYFFSKRHKIGTIPKKTDVFQKMHHLKISLKALKIKLITKKQEDHSVLEQTFKRGK
jgi:hypothetical protein